MDEARLAGYAQSVMASFRSKDRDEVTNGVCRSMREFREIAKQKRATVFIGALVTFDGEDTQVETVVHCGELYSMAFYAADVLASEIRARGRDHIREYCSAEKFFISGQPDEVPGDQDNG